MHKSVVLLLFLFLFSCGYAAEYKPYLHAAALPDHPAVRLYGQYHTLLFPGAASYAYPLEVPPGTHGLQPTVTLAYNSQAALGRPGILGAGWAINQNYLARDTNGTLDNTSDDQFILYFENHVYELVYDPQQQTWRTQVDYHFRIQNLTTSNNTRCAYWVLTTTDGVMYRFGATYGSETMSNTGRSYAVRWYQDLITDTFGNTITYEYDEQSTATYLARVAYDRDQRRVVEFTYASRPDPRAVYDQGNLVAENQRLTDITVLADGDLVRRYHLNYTTLNPAHNAVSSVTRYGTDNVSILHTVAFSYYQDTPGFSSLSSAVPVAFGNSTTDFGVRLADVDNDGYTDLLQGRGNTSTKQVWRNSQQGGWTTASAWVLPEYFVNATGYDTGLRVFDIDNDGLADLVRAKNGSIAVYVNNGTGWVASNWTVPLDFVNATGSDLGVQIADLNGDGLADLLRATTGLPNATWLNNGSGWRNASWTIPVGFTNGNDTGARLVDVNGDALPDLLMGNGTSRLAWLNNGAGWTNSTTWVPPVDFRNASVADLGVRFADLNGDGLTDIVQHYRVGTQSVNASWMNNGTGWVANNSYLVGEALCVNGSNIDRRLADVNGDGLADLLVSNTSTNRTLVQTQTFGLLLATITNEYGGNTTITYTTATRYNNTDDGISRLGFAISVVERITRTNGLSTPFDVTGVSNYSYRGGKYNTSRREFRGFAITTVQTPTALVRHFFYQDAPRKAKERRTEQYTLNGTLFSAIEHDYNSTYLYGIYNLSLRSTTEYTYDGLAVPRVVNTSYVYDWFGNPRSIVEHGDVTVSGDERTTNSTYAYNPNTWVLNRVAKTTVYDALGDRVSETLRHYDGQGLTGVSRGALTRQEAWNNHGNNTIMQYEHDEYGNVVRQTDSAGGVTQYAYDATHTYPQTVINALGHVSYFSYDLGTGNLQWTRKNDITTTYAYDTHGRITKEIKPYDDTHLPTKEYEYFLNGSPPSRVRLRTRTTGEHYQETNYYYDGLGDLVQVKTRTDGAQAVKNLYYDGSGRAVAEDHPYLDTVATSLSIPSGVPQTNYTYDALDRVVLVKKADGTNLTTQFAIGNITDYDENGHRHVYRVDARGRIVAVHEFNSDPRINGSEDEYVTTYAYDGNDNLVRITDAHGNTFHFTYDSLGHKIAMQDPDMGEWNYAYDARGSLVRQTDARNTTITLSYDLLGRITQKQSDDVNVTFTYDVQYQGTLANLTMGDEARHYTYDERYRVVSVDKTILGVSFPLSFVYDAQDRIISVSGFSKLDNLFDTQGKVRTIPGYVTSASYDAFGALLNRTYENGLVATYTYDTLNHRLVNITIPAVQHLEYTYDAVGNILTIDDETTNVSSVLTYDGLDRLVEAQIGNDQYVYSYNALGNIMGLTHNDQSTRMVYAGLAHAPSSVILTGAGADVSGVHELTGSKNRTVSFFVTNDKNTSSDGVNVSVAFGDNSTAEAKNLSINTSVLFVVQHNYTTGGEYCLNVSAASNDSADYEPLPTKFGVRANTLTQLAANASLRTFEFDVGSDVVEVLPNVTWNCTDVAASLPINLSSSLFDYFTVNYTAPGHKTLTCTASGADGTESQSLSFTIEGMAIDNYDTLYTNVSRRVVGFGAVNRYYPVQANMSVSTEGFSSSALVNLTQNEAVLVFVEVNDTLGDQKGIAVALSGDDAVNYTDVYDIKSVSIDAYQRVDVSNLSRVYLYAVRNLWENGTVAWNLTDPSLSNATVLANNASVLIFVAHNYTTDATPALRANSGGYIVSVADQSTVRPMALSRLLTLYDGPSAVSELLVENLFPDTRNVTWRLDTSLDNVTNTTTVNDSLLVYVAANYSSGSVYRTTGVVNSSEYNDTKTSAVVA